MEGCGRRSPRRLLGAAALELRVLGLCVLLRLPIVLLLLVHIMHLLPPLLLLHYLHLKCGRVCVCVYIYAPHSRYLLEGKGVGERENACARERKEWSGRAEGRERKKEKEREG